MILDCNLKKDVLKIQSQFLKKKYDYIIIGTGPAGIALYRSILKKKEEYIVN